MGYVGKVAAGGATHLVGSTLYGRCETGASTANKVVTCEDFTDLITGVTIHVKFGATNSAAGAKLNVNGTGNVSILGTNGTITGIPKWNAGAVVSFTYDGTYWCMNDVYFVDNDTKNTAGSTDSTNKLYLIGAASQATYSQTYSNNGVYITNQALTVGSVNNVFITSATSGGNAGEIQILSAGTVKGITVPAGEDYTLGAACEKAIGSVASGNTGLVTGGDVYTAIQSAAAGSLQYQGTATSDSDIGTSYHAGWYWIVGSAGGTIAGQTVEAGDMILAHADYSGTLADDLDIVQSNVDRITNSDIDTIVAA